MDNPKRSDDRFNQQETQRVELPRRSELDVIVDFNRRLEKVERKVNHFGDLTILVIGVGLGISVGESCRTTRLPEDWNARRDFGYQRPLKCRISSVVEQRFCKPLVGSSNLSSGTSFQVSVIRYQQSEKRSGVTF